MSDATHASEDASRELGKRDALIRTSPSDRYFDYCLEPYRPRRRPAGKLRSENLLWASLEYAGVLDQVRPPLLALQKRLGRDMVVWGVKYDGDRLWWELYIYDPRKEDSWASVEGLAEILAPWIRIVPRPAESIPYMMVSFDIDEKVLESGSIDEINLYLPHDPKRHEGRSYRVRESDMEFDNVYRFLDPKVEIDTLLGLIHSSASIDYSDPRTLAAVLIPEFFACRRICAAKKRRREGIYFSGIDIDKLTLFLRRYGYPVELRETVDRWASELDHLSFDVGIDVEQRSDGSIQYSKTSFYGTL